MRMHLVFISALLLLANAQKCPIPSWLQERIVPLNSWNGTTFGKLISEDKDMNRSMHQIVSHFEFLGEQKDEGRPKTESVREGVKNPWRCERNADRLASAVKYIMKNFGWRNKENDGFIDSCRTVLKSDDRDFNRKMRQKNTPAQLFSRIRAFGEDVGKIGEKVGRSYGLRWERYVRVEEGPFEADRFRKCRYVKALGYRISGKWSLAVRISNTEVGFEEDNGRRKTLNEFVRPDGKGGVTQEKVSIPLCKNNRLLDIRNGTASVSMWEGEHTWSHFANFPTDLNPALNDALEKSEFNKELVEDINNPSSFIALWLPTIVVMIPLALFQDWDPRTSFLYRIVTDFIAILPFASKGIELIVNGSKRTYATVSYVYGAKNLEDLAAAETWVAVCQMRPYVAGIGAFCLLLIVLQIIIGIIFEIRTRSSLAKFVSSSRNNIDETLSKLVDSEVEQQEGDDGNIEESIKKTEQDNIYFRSRGNGLLWHYSQATFPVDVLTNY